jgi:hypothetical protein
MKSSSGYATNYACAVDKNVHWRKINSRKRGIGEKGLAVMSSISDNTFIIYSNWEVTKEFMYNM